MEDEGSYDRISNPPVFGCVALVGKLPSWEIPSAEDAGGDPAAAAGTPGGQVRAPMGGWPLAQSGDCPDSLVKMKMKMNIPASSGAGLELSPVFGLGLGLGKENGSHNCSYAGVTMSPTPLFAVWEQEIFDECEESAYDSANTAVLFLTQCFFAMTL